MITISNYHLISEETSRRGDSLPGGSEEEKRW